MKNKVGFWGYPNPEIISIIKSDYDEVEWVDLDIDMNYPKTNILPDAYCKIIKNIIDNAVALKDDMVKIVAPIGKDKCDSGWFAAKVLKDLGFDVVESIYESVKDRKTINISVSNLPLIDKVSIITNNIIERKEYNYPKSNPQFGFWGVPPNDLGILKLFPDNTHLYGWLRCIDAGTPADIDLEMYVNPDVPTVFYAQAFCAKCQLAKYLADKYNGLYIDIDDYSTNSVRAKIEAFLKLR